MGRGRRAVLPLTEGNGGVRGAARGEVTKHGPSPGAQVQQGAAWEQMGFWKEGVLESDRKQVCSASPWRGLPCVVWEEGASSVLGQGPNL